MYGAAGYVVDADCFGAVGKVYGAAGYDDGCIGIGFRRGDPSGFYFSDLEAVEVDSAHSGGVCRKDAVSGCERYDVCGMIRRRCYTNLVGMTFRCFRYRHCSYRCHMCGISMA